MTELTADLSNVGFQLAAATCKPWIFCAPVLEQCGFGSRFEAVVGSYHNGVPEHKSAVIPEALRLLKVPAETTVMTGDRAADVEGARSCGILCVCIAVCGYAEPGVLERAGALKVVQTVCGLEYLLHTE